jgi:hypothetical protein
VRPVVGIEALGLRALRLFQHGVSFREVFGNVLPWGVRLVMPAVATRPAASNSILSAPLGAACAAWLA